MQCIAKREFTEYMNSRERMEKWAMKLSDDALEEMIRFYTIRDEQLNLRGEGVKKRLSYQMKIGVLEQEYDFRMQKPQRTSWWKRFFR